jgi:flagellar motor component MotA
MLIDGPVGVLMQPAEFIVIVGAAIGSVVAGSPIKLLLMMARRLPVALKGSPYNKTTYSELLRVLYEVFINAKKGGLLSIEEDVNSPAESSIFSKYPKFLHNHKGCARDGRADDRRQFSCALFCSGKNLSLPSCQWSSNVSVLEPLRPS